MANKWLLVLEELAPCLNGLCSNVFVVLHNDLKGVSTDATLIIDHVEVRTETVVDVAVDSERT